MRAWGQVNKPLLHQWPSFENPVSFFFFLLYRVTGESGLITQVEECIHDCLRGHHLLLAFSCAWWSCLFGMYVLTCGLSRTENCTCIYFGNIWFYLRDLNAAHNISTLPLDTLHSLSIVNPAPRAGGSFSRLCWNYRPLCLCNCLRSLAPLICISASGIAFCHLLKDTI